MRLRKAVVLLGVVVPAAAAASINSTASDPNVNFLVIANNRDHLSCPGSTSLQGVPWTLFYSLPPPGTFSCNYFPFQGDSDQLSLARLFGAGNSSRRALQATADIYFSARAKDSGITLVIFEDAGCNVPVATLEDLPYGSCQQPKGFSYHFSIDAATYLPSPSEGRTLLQFFPQLGCKGTPFYSMFDTQCHSIVADFELACGELVGAAYSTVVSLAYRSENATCTGPGEPFVTITPETCTGWGEHTTVKSVWCGAGCRRWKTMRFQQPVCDQPDAGTPAAINLTQVFGPECSSEAAAMRPGACCYEPLGYDGGVPFGTSCDKACGLRYGEPQEWCQISTGADYGCAK